MISGIIASNDIERARISRDISRGELRQRLTIEWRGRSLYLKIEDNEGRDDEWWWAQLADIAARKISLTDEGDE